MPVNNEFKIVPDARRQPVVPPRVPAQTTVAVAEKLDFFKYTQPAN